MKTPIKIIPANKDKKLNFIIFIAIYILLLLSIDSIIDYFLLLEINTFNLFSISEIDQKKKILSIIVYGVLRLLPVLWIAWVGYRTISSARLPPARMELPFSVPAQSGRKAKITGVFVISLSLLLMAQNVAYVVRQLISY